MSKPLVAIIGRPNAGKSTLFNRMVGGRRAIVEAVEGVTRDRNYADAEWEGKNFIVVDTGGFYPEAAAGIFPEAKEQALFAAQEADLIIHLLDARQGLTPADLEMAGMLRASGKKVLWAANKIDAPTREDLLTDFFRIGEEVLPVSAATGYMFEEFMEKLAAMLPEAPPPGHGPGADMPKIAVVGRPNVGKSTFINSLLGKKRLVVTSVAGTTRDAIDVVCTYYGKKYLFIDTAGIRRKFLSVGAYPLERFSMVMAYRSIERSDVAVVLMDASEGIVSDDQKIAGLVHEGGKGAVFVLNKWDLVPDPEDAYKRLRKELARKLWFFSHAPVLAASGLERKAITKIFPLIDGVLAERRKTVPAGELDGLMDEIARDQKLRLPVYRGRKVRVYSIRQIGKEPPVFALNTSEPAGLKERDLKYFERRLRERFHFAGTPVKVVPKRKK